VTDAKAKDKWTAWSGRVNARVKNLFGLVDDLQNATIRSHDHAEVSRTRLSLIEDRLAALDGGEGHKQAAASAYARVSARRDEEGRRALSFTLQRVDGALMFVPREEEAGG